MEARSRASISRVGTLLLALAACLHGCGGPKDARTENRPNILLIVVDTLRADRLGVYGYGHPTSPSLDSLAGRGVRLERFTAVAPSTLASFTSMLTGRYPHSHGVYRNGVVWPEGLEGMQSVFQRGGYETAAFVASYCLSSDFGISRGFDHFDEELTIAMEELPQNKLIRHGAEVTSAVSRWLTEDVEDGQPFFAMVHYFDPHWPYAPPQPFDRVFDGEYQGPVTGSMEDLRRARLRLIRSGGRADADSNRLHALHLGEIRYTDEQIGSLVESLEKSGHTENTLVVVTADHGETFYEHPDYFNHGLTVYDSNIRIPLIAVGPGIIGHGRVIETAFSNIDLAPTLLEYVGLETPAGFEGRSFFAHLTDELPREATATRQLFAEATKPHFVEASQRWPNRLKARCIMSGRWKLIHTPWSDGRWELYDLLEDPDESRNLWRTPDGPPDLGALSTNLDAWSEIVPTTAGVEREISPEALERLRSLGYVE